MKKNNKIRENQIMRIHEIFAGPMKKIRMFSAADWGALLIWALALSVWVLFWYVLFSLIIGTFGGVQ